MPRAQGWQRKPARTVKPQLPAEIDWNHPLSQGLVGCWLLGDNFSGKALDIGPYKIHGTLNNFANTDLVASHHAGLATNFDNTNNTISGANFPAFAAANSFSFSAWCNFRTIGQGNTGRILSITTASGADSFIIATGDFGSANAKALSFTVDTAAHSSFTTAVWTTGVWFHMALTYKSGGPALLYINGKSQAWSTDGVTQAFPAIAVNAAWAFSDKSSGGATRTVDGWMEGVRIWRNRILQLSDVAQLYAEPYGGILQAPTFNILDNAGAAAFLATSTKPILQAVNRAGTY